MVNEPLLCAGLKNSTSRMWPWEGQDRKVEGTEYARKLAEPSQSPYAGVQKGDSYAYITSFPKSREIKMDDKDKKIGHLEHLLKHRTNQLKINKKHWVRAAKKALDGDMKELRLRVELHEDTSEFKIVQSK